MGEMVQEFSTRVLSQSEVEAYDSPYPDEEYKIAPRTFPMIHPVLMDCSEVDYNLATWNAMTQYDNPLLTLYSDTVSDTSTPFKEYVPGAKNKAHELYANCSFFLPEDKPKELAAATIQFICSD